ncbi:hypothetical protein CI109_106949 [Kwoniella shandongensis]|uniref:Uncharacterized protein n=1 Tax=Kwoniella shandongensis TaxID=1734106 RepID=A0A5M6C653_9TREE|nr:uncharacterized protein CI109_000797 [Kwoniella shandongensis]KAA5530617.1 hypothetical protein CI109_000797 [Kwoniella shandongensis]
MSSALPNANAQASSSKHKSKSKHHDSGTKSSSKHHNKSNGETTKSKSSSSSSSSKSDKSPFEHRLSRMRLSIAPKFGADVMSGVREKLDGMIMRYVSQMGGVLLAHWEHSFVDDTTKIMNECPFNIIEVEFHSILWAPKIGQKLYGTHSLSSPSHLSLLFSKTFNVSIPLQHIPTDFYEFEHTDEADDLSSDSEDEDDDLVVGVHDVGRWKEKSSGKLLGEGGKGIKFTVIGMQVTNQMLSLTGSLLADPANPPPLPEPSLADIPSRPSPTPSPSPEPESSRPTKQQRTKAPAPAPVATYDSAPRPVPTSAPEAEVIDTRFMNARDLKKFRKEEEKKKRDARKARKEEQVLEEVQEVGAERLVDAVGIDVEGTPAAVGVKRKAGAGGAGEEEKRKKKK